MNGIYNYNDPLNWPWGAPGTLLGLKRQIKNLIFRPRSGTYREALQKPLAQLRESGVTILDTVVDQKFVDCARKDLDRFEKILPDIANRKQVKLSTSGENIEYDQHVYHQDVNIYRSHNPLTFSPFYARFLLLPDVVEMARCYLGSSWRYQAMIATRTGACRTRGEGFDHWHHDARGRKLNVFLLLTDVPPESSATQVVEKSHFLLYDKSLFANNFFADDQVDEMIANFQFRPRDCSASAGSLVFFDSHALHRGRRSQVLRDAFQVNLMTSARECWPHEIPETIFRDLSNREQSMLMRRSRLKLVP